MKRFLILSLISLILLLPVNAPAQETSLGRGVYFLSRYIASEQFANLKLQNDDLSMTDSLYLKALDYTDGNISEALLFLTFTTVPYNKIPLVIPGIRLSVPIPLVSANDSIFELKNRNLPSQLFFDTPQDGYGDRDKLAHFFGSAYLSHISNIFDFTKIIGIFVEEFEEKFYIQSKADPRDIRADDMGNMFGKALKKNKKLMPSHVLGIFPLTLFRY
ncbi:MAG: hypothetical protein ACM3SM_10675 [Bacteroidota bacterium]